MKIRAHHLLCSRNFKGKGYSEEFVENFKKIIERMNNNEEITIVAEPDDICKSCPHNNNGCVKKGPDSEIKVKEHDKRVLDAVGINPNTIMSSKQALEIVNKKITKEDIPVICKDCEWIELCT